MLFVAGGYIPEGVLPGDAGTEKEIQMAEEYPAHATEKQVIRCHMAQTLTLQTVRPDTRSDCKRYNVRGANRREWAEQQTFLAATSEYRGMQKQLASGLEGREGIHLAALFDKMNKVPRMAFAKRYAKPKSNETRNDAMTFLRNNKQHGRIREYAELLKDQKYKKCREIQREIARDNWKSFSEQQRYQIRKRST